MRFEGEFCPPTIGHTSVPIPIAGPGHIELTDTELIARGMAAGGLSGLMVLGSMAGAAAGVFAVKFLLFPDMSPEVIGGVIGATAVGSAMAGRSARKDKPMELRIPVSKIKSATLDKANQGAVLIKVVKHKPKGTIHFRPASGAEGLVAEVSNLLI